MSRTSCLGMLMVIVLGAGCVAPQSPGAERTAYLSMATTSGALGGAMGLGLGCSLLRTGWKRKPSKGIDGTDAACMIAGAAGGGAASFFGSSESEDSPAVENWVLVSLGTAAAAAIVTAFAIEIFD